jgi:hypothetical protein
MATTTSKLPTGGRPIIRDTELAAGLEQRLAPLSGARLERAQAAVRKVATSGVQGPFTKVLAAYQSAIRAGDKET